MRQLRNNNDHNDEEVNNDSFLELLMGSLECASCPDSNPAVEELVSLQTLTGGDGSLGPAPSNLQPPVQHEAHLTTAQPGVPHPSSRNSSPAGEQSPDLGPVTQYNTARGAAPLSLHEAVLPAQPGVPHRLPYPPGAGGQFIHPQPQTQYNWAPEAGLTPVRAGPPSYPALNGGQLVSVPPSAHGPAHAPYQPTAVPLLNYYAQPGSAFQALIQDQVNNNMPVMAQPPGHLTPLGYINGNLVYGMTSYSATAGVADAPVAKASGPRKRKYTKMATDNSKPYITKPTNAFMIYRKEQMPLVKEELQISDCAPLNQIIGKRWKSMTKEQQAVYYERSELEKQLHAQLFPEWSAGDNYGKKRKRIRRKAGVATGDSV